MRHIATAVALTCVLTLLCSGLLAEETKPKAAKRETLRGTVIEKRANVKSFEAWNAPSDPYYVLELDLKPGKKGKKRHVTLRPSKTVSTAELKKHSSLKVIVRGSFVEGKPYKPSEFESFPIELADPLGPAPKDSKKKARPALRGAGFVVLEIRAPR